MNKRVKWTIIALIILGIVISLAIYVSKQNVEVLNPKGPIAYQERKLMIEAALLSLIVVVPVFIITFTFAWKYRASNKKAKYRPELDGNLGAEIAWWTIPSVLILILSFIAWNSSHQLDPYKVLVANGVKPINIQVVSMDWKWLFIYPDQGVASVNMMDFPVNTPLNLYITSDAPMNSLWIPQLGGQIYSMPGMQTQLHLMADQDGDYRGSSANISGNGFAGMHFIARASSNASFSSWVKTASNSTTLLDDNNYARLNKPSIDNPVTYYALGDNNLFNEIMNKYMTPGGQNMMSSMGEEMQ